MPAVSWSRISPTRTMFGSWRRIDRSPAAKVTPARVLIWTWLIPSSWYSIGSSTVMMFFTGDLIQLRDAYRRSEEHTSELQSRPHLVCRLLLEKKKKKFAAAN